MIQLSPKLTKYINGWLNTEKDSFTMEELSVVNKLSINKSDIEFLKYFENLNTLQFSGFPSVSASELDEVANMLPKLKELVLVDQNALITIDLSLFFSLEKIDLISNDNLVNVFNLDKLVNLKEVTIYDNKKLIIDNLYDDIIKLDKSYKIDLVYYYELVNYFIKNNVDISDVFYDKVSFVDVYGYRTRHFKVLKKTALIDLLDNISNVSSLYCFKNETDIQKYCSIYQWMLNNIEYVNEDVEEHLDYYGVVDAFIFNRAGRLSYARVFQMLLLSVGIKSDLVYSASVNEDIGRFNGNDMLKFEGTGDYALVRSLIDGKYYYTDIAWNKHALVNNSYNELNILLESKESIVLKHNLVGEGIVDKTATYNKNALKDVIISVQKNIHDVDYMFKDVALSSNEVESSKEMFAENNAEINELKRKISQEEVGSELYNSMIEELISLEKVINTYNKILVKYNNGQRELINKYSDFLLANYLCVLNLTKVDSVLVNELKLKDKYHVISIYLFDLLNMYLSINGLT